MQGGCRDVQLSTEGCCNYGYLLKDTEDSGGAEIYQGAQKCAGSADVCRGRVEMPTRGNKGLVGSTNACLRCRCVWEATEMCWGYSGIQSTLRGAEVCGGSRSVLGAVKVCKGVQRCARGVRRCPGGIEL